MVKIGIVKGFANKVFNLCDESYHNKNLIQIEENLLLNSYPENFIDRYNNIQRKKWYIIKNIISNETSDKEPINKKKNSNFTKF